MAYHTISNNCNYASLASPGKCSSPLQSQPASQQAQGLAKNQPRTLDWRRPNFGCRRSFGYMNCTAATQAKLAGGKYRQMAPSKQEQTANPPHHLPASPGCVLRNLQDSIFKKDGATAGESQPATQIWTLQLIISQMPIIFAAAVDAPAWYSYGRRRTGCIGMRTWPFRLVAIFSNEPQHTIQKRPAVGNLSGIPNNLRNSHLASSGTYTHHPKTPHHSHAI